MQNTIFIQYARTPLGELIVGSYNEQLCLCDWRYRKMRISIDKRIQTLLNASFTEENSSIIRETFSVGTSVVNLFLSDPDSEKNRAGWLNRLSVLPIGYRSVGLKGFQKFNDCRFRKFTSRQLALTGVV